MARHLTHSRPLSADFTPRPSMLLSLLPTAVKSRLPHIPSLRERSNSWYGYEGRRESVSAPGSGSQTPVVYSNAMVLSSGDEAVYFPVLNSEEELTPEKRRLLEDKSGIGWKFANQGLNLLSLSVDEASTISANSNFGNAGFARQLYVHSLTYLLRGLPSDLTAEEQLSIRTALPSGIVQPINSQSDLTYDTAPTEPSLLHRTLASTIIQLFLFFQFVLPYLTYFAGAAYQYEREHKISERVFSQGIETGKRGVDIAGMLLAMGDGKVGKLTAWVVEGVTGGIHEGLGEGMAILVTKQTGLEVH